MQLILAYSFARLTIYNSTQTHRQSQEEAQKILFQKAKFASFLIENFVPYSAGTTKEAVRAGNATQIHSITHIIFA